MDFQRFEELKQKHADAVRRYQVGIQVAQAHVEATEAQIKILHDKRKQLAGIIDYNARKEFNALTGQIRELEKKLAQRQKELVNAKCNGNVDDVIKQMNF